MIISTTGYSFISSHITNVFSVFHELNSVLKWHLLMEHGFLQQPSSILKNACQNLFH
jgi:hypothetical protein